MMLAGKGDLLPVSAFPVDGTWPTGTAQWEKRNIADEIPVWDPALCIQCNKCALVCPHAAIRAKVYRARASRRRARRTSSPIAFKAARLRRTASTRSRSRRRTAPAARSASSLPGEGQDEPAAARPSTWRRRRRCATPSARTTTSSCDLPEVDRARLDGSTSRARSSCSRSSSTPGACAGCGETPYVKLLTQLFGDRRLIANATGCSLHLRRQPPDDAVHARTRRPRTGLGQLALRGQRGVRARACASRSTSRSDEARRAARRARRRSRRRARGRAPRARTSRSDAGIAAQRERVAARSSDARPPCRAAEARRLERWPTSSSRRASGSWAATAGPTTSATAGSTTCWPAAAT